MYCAICEEKVGMEDSIPVFNNQICEKCLSEIKSHIKKQSQQKGEGTNYPELQEKILIEITEFCKNHCAVSLTCAEDECVLWRIEKIITTEQENKEMPICPRCSSKNFSVDSVLEAIGYCFDCGWTGNLKSNEFSKGGNE